MSMSWKPLKINRLGTQKRMKNGPKMWFSTYAVGEIGELNHMCSAYFVTVLGYLDTL